MSTWFATPPSRTTAAMPGAAAAEPYWAPKTSRRSPCAERSAPSGRIRSELTALSRSLSKRSLRSRYGEVPRARHRDQSAHVQPLRRAAHAQFSERHIRRSRQPLARATERDALQNTRKLRDLHHRLRAHLLAGQERRARRVRKPVRAGFACAAWATPTPCCAPPSAATSSASTPSAPEEPSRSRWSASSADGSTASRG